MNTVVVLELVAEDVGVVHEVGLPLLELLGQRPLMSRNDWNEQKARCTTDG